MYGRMDNLEDCIIIIIIKISCKIAIIMKIIIILSKILIY